MKRPAFQFYPGDWAQNPNLRRCTHEEKGAWIDIMCLMHDQDEYGVLRWPLREIAQAAGARMAVVAALVAKGVLKGADAKKTCEALQYVPRHAGKDGDPVTLVVEQEGPIWYSSRMVRDEYVRTRRGIGTRFGEEPKTPLDDTPKPPFGVEPKPPFGVEPKPPFGDGASTSSSSSSSNPHPARANGLASKAMRDAGIAKANPSHPELIALVDAGATPEQFAEAAREAIRKAANEPFGYALAVLKSQMQRAATTASSMPARNRMDDFRGAI